MGGHPHTSWRRVWASRVTVRNAQRFYSLTQFEKVFIKKRRIESLTWRCIPQDLQGSQVCCTYPAACTAGWSLLWWETVAAER